MERAYSDRSSFAVSSRLIRGVFVVCSMCVRCVMGGFCMVCALCSQCVRILFVVFSFVRSVFGVSSLCGRRLFATCF